MLEKVNSCIICKSLFIKSAYVVPDWSSHSNQLFSYSFCDSCHITFLSKRPFQRDIAKYYRKNYQPYNADYVSGVKAFISWRTKKEIITFKRYNPYAKKVLEIGASFGAYLNDLRNYGSFSVVGAEMDQRMCEVGRTRYKIPMYSGDVNKINFRRCSFDIVIMNHVIEHLYDPERTVKKINTMLRPKGILFVKTPNIDSVEKVFFKKYWAPFEAPRHTLLFSSTTLRELLQKNGFVVQKVYFERSPNNLILSTKNYLSSKTGLRKFSKYFDLNNYLFLVLLLPISYIFGVLGISGRVVVIAQKN